MSTIAELIEAQAAVRPDATYAIATETGRSLTFAGLRDSRERVAAILEGRGLEPGAHVSIVMSNGLATLRILLGAMASGACVNPVQSPLEPRPDALRARPLRLRAGVRLAGLGGQGA